MRLTIALFPALLLCAGVALAQTDADARIAAATMPEPAPATQAAPPSAPPAAIAPAGGAGSTPGSRALPPMLFASSIAEDLLYEQFKARPEFAKLEKDVSGTPLYLIVTHTVRPTSGGAAAGLLTAFLSGSTLGLVPIVTNDEYVLRYEVWMHGKAIASWSYSRSKTRAQNLWTMNGDPTQALGKEGMEWLKTTTAEVADKVLHDPAVARVQAEIDYYFPAVVTTAAAAVPATAPAGPPDAAGKAAPAGTK